MRIQIYPYNDGWYCHSAFLLISIALYSPPYQEAEDVPGVSDGRRAVC